MYYSKQWMRRTGLGLAFLLGVLCCSPTVVKANEQDDVRQGLPGRRISGGSRLPITACTQNSAPLVAIVPETNLGATAVADPTLWLSVPEVTSAKSLEFYLFNAQDEIIYQAYSIVQPTADLVGIDLSTMANVPQLEVGQRYRWAASIVCNPNNRSENIAVEGWIDRVDAAQLDDGGLWYDRLGLLVKQLQHQPDDQAVLQQWQTLMASARLDQIVPLALDANSVEMASPETVE